MEILSPSFESVSLYINRRSKFHMLTLEFSLTGSTEDVDLIRLYWDSPSTAVPAFGREKII